MNSLKFKKEQNINEMVQSILGEKYRVFEVVPLDYRIKDFSTPKIFVSDSKLLFTFDDVVEVYELPEISIEYSGANPKFTIWQILTEGNYMYTESEEAKIEQLKQVDDLPRLTITSTGAVPKDFLHRSGFGISKSYKTWAMTQTIVNIKSNMQENPVIIEMLDGYFSRFNSKTVLSFIGIFIAYFILSPVSTYYLPSFISTILDILFVIVLLFMIWWLYSSVSGNLKRFETVYLSFK